jgi:site-specific DNA recombinase
MDKTIKNVAIYLRKSRDDGEYEDVLAKHRDRLVELAKSNNWSFVIYQEIASGGVLALRTEMLRLLKDIDLFDGILVMDIDRLGRGDFEEWGKILNIFIRTRTFIITPQRTYDPTLDIDELSLDLQSFFAKYEFKMIKKRLAQGKLAGAKKGMWTNGKPPFPYKNNSASKNIEVDEEKRSVYRLIIEKYLAGMSTQELSVWLNKNKVPTPTGKMPFEGGNRVGWSNTAVHRLLVDEVHLGRVVFGKHKDDGHRIKGGKALLNPKEEWIVAEGSHEQLKTRRNTRGFFQN